MAMSINAKSDVVLHTPIVFAVDGIELIINASTSSNINTVVRGIVFFRRINESEYISQPMIRSGDSYEATLPARYVTGKAIEYYITLYISDGSVITSPAQNPASMPYAIIIMPATQGWFEVLYPEANSVIKEKKPEITASFVEPIYSKNDIQIRLDGKNITQDCEITEYFFSYTPKKDLSSGGHSITLINLSKFNMAGSWQFFIEGKEKDFQDFYGIMSLTWQYADADSESKYLLYNKGSSFGILGQLGGKILNHQFDSWINRNALYGRETIDLGVGVYGDKFTINVGDIFPTMSKLTLDGMPAVGAEITIKPYDRITFQIFGAESRLFDDDKDKFLFDLLNSRFTALKASASPIKDKWSIDISYLYAKNNASADTDLSIDMEKRNNIISIGTKVNLPAQFIFQSEWSRSDNKTDYGEEFGIDTNIDQAFSAGISKKIKAFSFEAFYIDVGDNFISEVNPFIEIGRKGIGISGQYSYHRGLFTRLEYTRYYHDSDFDNQMRANTSIFLSGFPSLNLGYYQQRLPYAKYDVRGANIGSSYKISKFDISVNSSWSNSRFWVDETDRNILSLSGRINYNITKNTSISGNYYQYWGYKSDIISSLQRQFSFEIQQNIARKHSLGIGFKAVIYKDKNNITSNYNEKILFTKYQYSF
ncbi:TPA: porin [bacterium]|nr:porin [bacterium]